jgi:uncharacterized protein YndB with AHSA1/START domain
MPEAKVRAASAETTLVKTVFLKAPPSHVWKFLTTAKGITKWFHDAPHDLTPGGEWRCDSNSMGKEGDKLIWGEVIEMRPHEKLVHTFTHKGLGGHVTTCTWTLVAVGQNGTMLTLVHDNFPTADAGMLSQHDAGWDQHFARLRLISS